MYPSFHNLNFQQLKPVSSAREGLELLTSNTSYSLKHIILVESFSFLHSISFPDPNGTQRKGTVFITGTVDSVIHARAQLIVRKKNITLLLLY